MLVSDRGMIATRQIKQSFRQTEGLAWISVLRSEGVRKLVSQGCIQPGSFDDRYLAEIDSPDFPSERLIVCSNPLSDEECT